jgi:hypothetical protein
MPPPPPWKRGEQQGYKAFHIILEVCSDDEGRVYSSHHFREEFDEQVALTLNNGGVEQIAFAFLTETLRRELFVDMLVQLSGAPDYLERWAKADDTGKEELERGLSHAALSVLSKTQSRLAAGLAKEAFTRLAEDPLEEEGPPNQ